MASQLELLKYAGEAVRGVSSMVMKDSSISFLESFMAMEVSFLDPSFESSRPSGEFNVETSSMAMEASLAGIVGIR